MGQDTKSKKKRLTNLLKVDTPVFSTLGDIIGWMVDVCFQIDHPDLKARAHISSRLGMTEANLSLIINNKRPIDLNKFCLIVSDCKIPQVFNCLKDFSFPK